MNHPPTPVPPKGTPSRAPLIVSALIVAATMLGLTAVIALGGNIVATLTSGAGFLISVGNLAIVAQSMGKTGGDQ